MQNAGRRFDLKDYMRLFHKRKWLILMVFACAVAAGFAITRLQEPKYQATSVVIVKSYPRGFFMITGTARVPESLSLETQAAKATSYDVAESAYNSLKERAEGANTSLLYGPEDIHAALSARPSEPDLVLIQATTPDPERAVEFAGAAADAFVDIDLRDHQETSKNARDFLEGQLKQAEQALDGLQQDVLKEQKELGIVDPEAEGAGLLAALDTYRSLKTQAEAEEGQAQGEVSRLRQALDREQPVTAVSAPAPDPAAAELEKRLAEKRAELVAAKAKYNPSYPLVTALAAEVDELETAYEKLKDARIQRTEYLQNPLYGKLREGLADAETRVAGLQQRTTALANIVRQYQKQARAFPEKQAKLRRLLAQAEAQQTACSDLQQRLREAQTNEAMQAGNAQVLDKPTTAVQVAPQTQKTLVFAALIGALSGFAIAFMLELLDNTIRVSDDLTGDIAVPFLGMVPFMQNGAPNMLVTATAPKSPPAEAYRALRSNISFALVDDHDAKTFLVTSAGATEGKSVTAANIAVVLAQAGHEVLLVDTDLRRPQLHRFMEAESSPGITNLLAGSYSLDQVIQETAIPHLRVIASGPLPPNPSELLNSRRMTEVVAELRDAADYVIFDSPPAVVLTDAIVMSSKVDKTIFVAESARVTREAFGEMKRLVENAKGDILGAVINKLRLSPRDYYYYYYYYDYGTNRRNGNRGRSEGNGKRGSGNGSSDGDGAKS